MRILRHEIPSLTANLLGDDGLFDPWNEVELGHLIFANWGGGSIRKSKIKIARQQIHVNSRVDSHRDNDTQGCTETGDIIDIMSEQGETRRAQYIYIYREEEALDSN